MRTETPPPVRLADYQPFPFRIDSVRMLFRLHPSDTRVVTELAIMRTGAKDAPLRLDGEKLALRSIRLNGLALGVDDYTADEESLTVFRPGDAFRLEIETSISPESPSHISAEDLRFRKRPSFDSCSSRSLARSRASLRWRLLGWPDGLPAARAANSSAV